MTAPASAAAGEAGAGGAPPLSWTVRRDGPCAGDLNMARDHALAERLPPATGVVRLYGWGRPTLSFGRNEPARDRYDAAGAERLGLAVVRRPTGGRAVLHHRELTYAVVVPVDAFGGPRDTYRRIGAALVRGLASVGVHAEIAGRSGPAARPGAGPCFRSPAEGEVVARGRKLVGSAQVRIGRALLQHGSILVEDDQALLERLRAGPAPHDLPHRPATLAGLLGRAPGAAELEDAVLEGFRASFGGRWDGEVPDTSREEARLLRERYGRSAWTWRR